MIFWTSTAIAQHEPAPALTPLAPGGGQVVYIEPSEDEAGHRLQVHLRYPPRPDASAPIQIDCEFLPLVTDRPIDILTDAQAVLRIVSEDGWDRHWMRIDLPVVSPEANQCRFLVDVTGLPAGAYTVRVELRRSPVAVVASRTLYLLKLSTEPVQAELERARSALGALRSHLDGLGVTGSAMPATLARLALAEDALSLAQTSAVEGDWRRAYVMSRYLLTLSDQLRAELTFLGNTPELMTAPPQPDLSSVSMSGGADGAKHTRPILLGARIPVSHAPKAIERLKRYGLRLAVLEPESGSKKPEYDAAFEAARAANVAIIASLASPGRGDGYSVLVERLDKDGTPDVPAGTVEQLRWLENRSHLLGVSLADRPRFEFSGSGYRSQFVQYIANVYQSVYRVNVAWKSRLLSFEDTPVERDSPLPIYQYDLQTFDQQVGSQILAQWSQHAAELLSGKAITAGFADDVLEPGHTRFGIDHETALASLDIAGCAIAHSLDVPVEDALVRSSLVYALFASLAPGKPLIALSQQFRDRPPHYFPNHRDFIHALAWDSAITGATGIAIDGWDLLGDTADDPRETLSTPAALDGLLSANVELNRNAAIVHAFHTAPDRIGILWSQSSEIYDEGEPFLPSVLRAYTGAVYAGKKVGFIPESRCTPELLSKYDAVILPQLLTLPAAARQALDDFILQGGELIRTTTPIPYDARGQSQHSALSYTRSVSLIRGGDDEPRHYLAAIDALLTQGRVPETPRLVNSFGYPALGVRTQSIEFEGATYLYALNMRDEIVTCQSNGAWSRGRDLISGQTIQFPYPLEPLTPMLLKLESPPDGSPLVTDGPQHPSLLKPLPQPPTEIPTATAAVEVNSGGDNE